MKMVTLRTGVEVPEPTLRATLVALEHLYVSSQVIALYELVEMCKDPAHVPFGNTAAPLTSLGLLENGRVHEVVRDIVLASFEGEGLDFDMVNPVRG